MKSRGGPSVVFALASVVVLSAAGAASAAPIVILKYSFDGSVVTPTTQGAGLTGSAIAKSGGTLTSAMVETTSPAYASAPVLRALLGAGSTTTVNTSFGAGTYFYFTVTPNPGETIDFSSIAFNAARGGAGTPRRLGVRTDLTGATNLLSTDVTTTRSTWRNYSADLSGYSQLQDVTGPAQFRIAVAAASGQSIEFDDITIMGTLSPEPATLGLLGLGLGAMLFRRRGGACFALSLPQG